jgi:biopolymer transport protein ExbD
MRAGDIVRAIQCGSRSRSFIVRFRMRHAPALLACIPVALLARTVPAQSTQDCVITINADGTCDAAGLHVPCKEVGPKLREVGISSDTHIRLKLDRSVPYDVVSATLQSVSHAALNLKIGYVDVAPNQ